jgi:hypothetical protein
MHKQLAKKKKGMAILSPPGISQLTGYKNPRSPPPPPAPPRKETRRVGIDRGTFPQSLLNPGKLLLTLFFFFSLEFFRGKERGEKKKKRHNSFKRFPFSNFTYY